MKRMTLGEAETKRRQAVEFLRRIGNDDAADEFDDMNAAEYAEHRGASIVENPLRSNATRAKYTPARTKADLQDELAEPPVTTTNKSKVGWTASLESPTATKRMRTTKVMTRRTTSRLPLVCRRLALGCPPCPGPRATSYDFRRGLTPFSSCAFLGAPSTSTLSHACESQGDPGSRYTVH